MKLFKILTVMTFVGTLSGFAMAMESAPPSTPAATKYSSGQVYTVSGDGIGRNCARAQVVADSFGKYDCASGSSVRISGYSYDYYSTTGTPDCYQDDRYEYCYPADTNYYCTAKATYRCR